jgi:hypothetical protein
MDSLLMRLNLLAVLAAVVVGVGLAGSASTPRSDPAPVIRSNDQALYPDNCNGCRPRPRPA